MFQMAVQFGSNNQMKILIVNTSDTAGGAARAAYRLHRALLSNGVNSQMLVQSKTSDDYTVIDETNKIKRKLISIRTFLDSIPLRFYKKRLYAPFSPSWLPLSTVVDRINAINPDIVHLHWSCSGMMSIEDVAEIQAPIVWSLHDMWAFTGGCHYDQECGGYVGRCGNCMVLGSDKDKDLSRKVWIRKQKTFIKLTNITLVGLSKWLENCAKNSSLFRNYKIVNLPNPIDTDIFKSFNKQQARSIWNLPTQKKLVLWGAMGATSDARKGLKELNDALRKLKITNVDFVVFGRSRPKNHQNYGVNTHYLGHLHDDVSLVTLYSAVDVVLLPSLQENLSNVIMEALSCATPVVAFDVGGNRDMVEHQVNGYLTKPFDTGDLANGIEWVLNCEKYDDLCRNAREKVLKEFDNKVVVKKYVELYKNIMKNDAN